MELRSLIIMGLLLVVIQISILVSTIAMPQWIVMVMCNSQIHLGQIRLDKIPFSHQQQVTHLVRTAREVSSSDRVLF